MLRLLTIALPLLEIAGFVLVGREIGLLATLGLVLLAALLGVVLIRRGGAHAFSRVRSEMAAGRDPGAPLVSAFLLLVAGVLLLLPGFLSDALALVLLLPPVRHRAWRALKGRVLAFGGVRRPPGGRSAPGPVIDLDHGDFSRRPDPSSPWAKPDGRTLH